MYAFIGYPSVKDYKWVTVNVIIIDYIDEIIAVFDNSKQIGYGIKTRDAPEDLYKVDEYCEKLSPGKANMFHNLVAKTLYTNKEESLDTCAAVSFPTTIVR